MRRPAGCSSSKGLLLVEAVLAATIIAVGLVSISRGLGSQLQAIQRVEAHDGAVAVAHARLLELEALGVSGIVPLPSPQEGDLQEAGREYRWTIRAVLREDVKDSAGRQVAADVTITVKGQGRGVASARLTTVWPSAWIPQAWF